MNCFFSKKKKAKKNPKVEKLLKTHKKHYNRDIKLLLLGTAESGKSTFKRQMHIIYNKGFSEKERQTFIDIIHANIFESIQNMATAMETLNINYEKSENNNIVRKIISYTNSENNIHLNDLSLTAIKQVWNDKGVQECYLRRNEYHLNDSTKYYLDEIDRIASPDYLPTEQDILRVRIETTGIVQDTFKVNKVTFRLIDVGGQRSQRRKWLHCFDNVKAIIFLVAISEYDQVLKENEQRNRLKESITIFETISNFFQDTPIIIFFNKTDLLDEKIKRSHFVDFFPEYKGKRGDSKEVREFILNIFLKIRPLVYSHFTCATDTENIRVVFTAVKDIILNKNLSKFGLV